ncbi:hypothetical protein VitviT2T_026698 [Vitis vinifera]|uniref:Uncharacterized protein n=1 Tax=Vitis vinifera TaxID=29760 RepID=A0ABY9DMM9_VITVI|nr:hypothetical protein VitviT2T_026698 [Vitis vinifera]
MRVTVLRNGTRVPKCAKWQLRNTLQNGTFVAKSGFSSSQCVSQLRNICSCTAKWHSCAKIGFAERGLRLQAGFAAKCRFHRGCEISQTPVFPLFSLRLTPILLRFCSERLPSISLQFLLILIIQKPILHQNKQN